MLRPRHYSYPPVFISSVYLFFARRRSAIRERDEGTVHITYGDEERYQETPLYALGTKQTPLSAPPLQQ
jgi:hypothetical protein